MLVVSFASSDFEADQTCCPRCSPHLRKTWWCGGENRMRYISSFVFIVAPWHGSTWSVLAIIDQPWLGRNASKFQGLSTYSDWGRSSYVWKFFDCLVSLIRFIQVSFSPRSAVYQLAQHFLFTGFLTHRGETRLRSTCAYFGKLRILLRSRVIRNMTFCSFANPQPECEGKWTLSGFRFDPSIFCMSCFVLSSANLYYIVRRIAFFRLLVVCC